MWYTADVKVNNGKLFNSENNPELFMKPYQQMYLASREIVLE